MRSLPRSTLSLPAIANGAAPLIAELTSLLIAESRRQRCRRPSSRPCPTDPVDALALAVSSLPASAPHPTNFAAGAGASSGGAGIAGSFIVNVITQTDECLYR